MDSKASLHYLNHTSTACYRPATMHNKIYHPSDQSELQLPRNSEHQENSKHPFSTVNLAKWDEGSFTYSHVPHNAGLIF